MNEEDKTYSIALRLRRVIHEDAYVAVPVTDAIIRVNEDGTGSIDFEKFVAEAIRVGQREGVDWKVEESSMEAHPLQCPVPEGRRMLDAHQSQADTE